MEETAADGGFHLKIGKLLLPFFILIDSKIRVVLDNRSYFLGWGLGNDPWR
jgi:hypothetical protein